MLGPQIARRGSIERGVGDADAALWQVQHRPVERFFPCGQLAIIGPGAALPQLRATPAAVRAARSYCDCTSLRKHRTRDFPFGSRTLRQSPKVSGGGVTTRSIRLSSVLGQGALLGGKDRDCNCNCNEQKFHLGKSQCLSAGRSRRQPQATEVTASSGPRGRPDCAAIGRTGPSLAGSKVADSHIETRIARKALLTGERRLCASCAARSALWW
jgi:hypothetical protein